MAKQIAPDPVQQLINDGRTRIVSYSVRSDVLPLVVNLDLLCNRLRTVLHDVYTIWEPLRKRYSGTRSAITNNITQDVNHMVDFALRIFYNRLRSVAERLSPVLKTNRMNSKAPCSDTMEFPSFLSSLLQSVGPLRITDGPQDLLVLYVPPPNTMQNFGRGAVQAPIALNYERLISNLRACGVHLTPIDMDISSGDFWTTCHIISADGFFDVVGTVHSSHYSDNTNYYNNERIPRSLLLDPNPTLNPFEDVTMTVGYVDDDATVAALAALAPPPNIPQGQVATSAGRPSGLVYDVNYFGIRPAAAATETTPARKPGCYVIGRGMNPVFTCYLVQNLSAYDIISILRHRLTR